MAQHELWIKVAVAYVRHPKVVQAGSDAAVLGIGGIGYAREFMTDGFVPTSDVPGLAPTCKKPIASAERLVAVGLWNKVEGGYTIHDYHVWNPTKQSIKDQRAKWKAEKDHQRELSGPDNLPDKGTDTLPETLPDNRPDPHAGARRAHSVSYSSSDGVDLGRGAGETNPIAPVWGNRGRSASLLAGPLAHGKCYQSAACERGLCIPRFLGDQWQRQCNGDMAQVQAFVTAALVGVSGPVGDDPLAWWREQWKAKHGSVARSGNRPTADDIRASNDAALEAALAGRMR